jgi:hypothetical protein
MTRILLIMLIAASSVLAQEFVKVDEKDGSMFYVDKTSVKKDGVITLFTGKVIAPAHVMFTDFATDCKSYVVLFEKLESAEMILTRKRLKPEIVTPTEDAPIVSAINYACYNTIKKSTPGGSLPEVKRSMSILPPKTTR